MSTPVALSPSSRSFILESEALSRLALAVLPFSALDAYLVGERGDAAVRAVNACARSAKCFGASFKQKLCRNISGFPFVETKSFYSARGSTHFVMYSRALKWSMMGLKSQLDRCDKTWYGLIELSRGSFIGRYSRHRIPPLTRSA